MTGPQEDDTLTRDDLGAVREVERATGTVGLVGAAGVAVILGIHPLGTTQLYENGPDFLAHVSGFWIAIHFLAVPLLYTFFLILDRWAQSLSNAYAVVLGRWASQIAVLGMALGALHLIGTDTSTFHAFADTFNAAGGSEASLIGADLLLRIHAATLISWVVGFWLPVSLLVGVALFLDGDRPMWICLLGPLAALSHLAAIIMFANEAHWSTFSETGAFRLGVTLLLALVALLAWEMRTGRRIGRV